MYVPQHFVENDPTTLAAFIDAHAFGTLVTSVDGGSICSPDTRSTSDTPSTIRPTV